MKKIILILITITSFVTSCSQKEISMKQLVDRNGVMFQVNKDKPFSGRATKKLENGQIIIDGNFVNGLRDGKWFEYFRNGQVNEKSIFSKGKRNGIAEQYYDNGILKRKAIYINGKMDGLEATFYMNGNPWMKIYRKNKKYNGSYEKILENGKHLVKTNYVDNQRHGKYLENFPNGKPKERSEYKNGKQIGSYEEYWENGNKKLSYNKRENGSFNGDYIIYNKDGSTQKHVFYTSTSSIRNKGTWKRYWTSDWNIVNSPSKYRSSVSFDDKGVPSTKTIFHYSNGKKYSEGYYSSIEPDVKDGEFKWYWKNGTLKKEVTYKKNEMHGTAKSYYKGKNNTGKNSLYQKVNFRNGEFHGKVEIFTGPGFRKGESPSLIKYSVNQMPRGVWKIQGQCVNGMYHGNFKVWWRYSTNRRREPFNMPMYVLHIWDNGKIKSNGYYKGRHTYYDKYGNKTTLKDRYRILDEVEKNSR